MKTILITGGYGYIGSHIALECLQSGYDVIIIDDLSNSKQTVGSRIDQITDKSHTFVQGDICNHTILDKIFQDYSIDMVIHCAAKKAVGESCEVPHEYYQTNILGTANLLDTMHQAEVRQIIFSSSTTVYDTIREIAPFDESMLTGGTCSPYGTSKVVCEMLLQDYVMHKGFDVLSLRYFNPIGAHNSGLIGEDPAQPPQSLLPVLLQSVSGQKEKVSVYGSDYDTPDGTCLRDYIHVSDVARAHVLGIEYLAKNHKTGRTPCNIGTGTPTSVLQMIQILEEVTGKTVPYVLSDRRAGDVAIAYANPESAKKLLGYQTTLSITQGVADAWKFWQKHFGL